jgi:hypothetical protein
LDYYHTKNREKAIIYAKTRNRTEKARGEQRAYRRTHAAERYRQRRENPVERQKDRARTEVSNALRSGRLVRPSRCSRCLVACVPHAHHFLGYEQEHWLDIVWLCVACHERDHHAHG